MTQRLLSLPANLPSIATAQFPKTYEAAKVALAECTRIDECKDWAARAAALASYAKMADDDELERLAQRIRARAIRRCGELLKEIERPAQGGRPPKNCKDNHIVSRSQAARDAGLSQNQKNTALRLASIPEEEFNEAVESDTPPTVTKLADRGTVKKSPFDIGDRDPEDFKAATEALGELKRFAELATRRDGCERLEQFGV